MDKLKILQWNCRGLNSKKKNDLISFTAEANIDVICLNEIKNWKKSVLLGNYIVAMETCYNGHHGTAILVKKSIVIKRTEQVQKEANSNGGTLETLKLCLNLTLFDEFWIITVYILPGKPLLTKKINSGKLKNVFVCVDVNAPLQELNCFYDFKNENF